MKKSDLPLQCAHTRPLTPTSLTQIDLVAVLLVSAVAHRARHVPAFDLRVRDPALPKPNVITFSCADNGERDRWLDGVAAHRRHLQRQLDWASEYQVWNAEQFV